MSTPVSAVRLLTVVLAGLSLSACGTVGAAAGLAGDVAEGGYNVAAGTVRLGARATGLTGGSRSGASVRVDNPAPIVSGTMRPYQIRGRWYHPAEDPDYEEIGMASWYGPGFDGRPTATGERFDQNALTAAHKTLPLPGLVEVTNLDNGRTVVLRLNDRGPFVDGRIIDLSRGAADELGLLQRGVGRVRVRYLGPAPRL